MTNHPNRSKRRYYVRCRRAPRDRWIYASKNNPPWMFRYEADENQLRTFTLHEGRKFAETVKRGRPGWEVELEPLPFVERVAATGELPCDPDANISTGPAQ